MSELLQVRVAARTEAAEEVVHLRLESTDGNALPPFQAGAHVDIHLPGGLVRQYSLCNAPGEVDSYELGVLRTPDSRGGSQAAHGLQVGDTVQISAPRNLFPLAQGAAHHLLLAGGIGITPLLSMAQALYAAGQSFQLHACSRSAARLPFAQRLRSAPWAGCTRSHLDSADGQPSHDLRAIIASAPAGSHVYACGPAGFISAARQAAADAGLDPSRFHSESFSAEVQVQEGDTGFEIEINDGRVFQVAADQTVAQCLEANGVFIALSCEQGICGTCVTNVREGIPDHRDSYLSEEERASNRLFTPCCSRARSPRLVLDIDA
jgi:vanillate O-demethylase ferredoxin subunit